VAMAQYFLAKIQKHDRVPAASTPSSLRADRVMATTRR